ncbi:hypothetical protein QYF61_026558 [Mycteria americana]|uniref:Secreted protein n=1 Tax=Mycteria americana TaxID=33587 RepID=A0AAN7PMR5_MYCAM|nr:hypothetical protein QYF61_026558 [Mycteria americana]
MASRPLLSSYVLLLSAAEPTPGTVCPKKDVEKLKRVQQKATGCLIYSVELSLGNSIAGHRWVQRHTKL